jgi:alanine dehydrogenase
VTFPYLRHLASPGPTAAIDADPALAHGVNARNGHLAHPCVANAFPDLPRG